LDNLRLSTNEGDAIGATWKPNRDRSMEFVPIPPADSFRGARTRMPVTDVDLDTTRFSRADLEQINLLDDWRAEIIEGVLCGAALDGQHPQSVADLIAWLEDTVSG
jgi:hypothetical protein